MLLEVVSKVAHAWKFVLLRVCYIKIYRKSFVHRSHYKLDNMYTRCKSAMELECVLH